MIGGCGYNYSIENTTCVRFHFSLLLSLIFLMQTSLVDGNYVTVGRLSVSFCASIAN